MLTYQQVQGYVPHSVSTPKEVISYLAVRGISITLAAQLGLKVLKADSLFSQAKGTGSVPLYPDNRYAIVFPHYSPLGFDIDWWSARLVPKSIDSGVKSTGLQLVHSFTQLTDPAISQGGKMFCPPNTPPAAYLPHAEGLPDWSVIPRGSRIYIHESAIKAINSAKLGYYSIGLNGVWGWSSRKHNIALLPEIRDLDWKRLELQPIILFDTNINTSQQVELASKRLAAKLLEVTGRTPKLLRMSTSPDLLNGEDYGFDDYAMAVGETIASQFLNTPDEDLDDIDISEVELMRLELNDKVCVISSISRVAEIGTGTLMTGSAFTELNYAHYQAQVETADGNLKQVSVPKLWLKDPRRTVVNHLAYLPGQPTLCPDRTYLNTWHGMGANPDQGDVSRWLELLARNAPNEDISEWMLDWLAYPLQNLGCKLNTLMLIFGPSGTGKDLFLSPIHSIYGQNAIKISNDELKSTFTSIYAAKQFVHADELKRVANAADAVNQKIKGLVTNHTMTVNRKGDPEYKIKNVINMAITSNYYDCVKLDEDDRRAAVIRWTPITPANDMRGMQDYWKPLAEWLQQPATVSAIYYYLLNRDLSKFDPAAWAPSTNAKEEVIDAARSPIERFVSQLRTDPQLHLPSLTDGRCLFTAKELAMYHYGTDPAKGQIDSLANELRNQNFVQGNSGKSIRSHSGVNRWWVIQRPDVPKQDWAAPAVCAAHLKSHAL